MNTLNYASLEASKKLVDAGIILETENVWVIPVSINEWKIVSNKESESYSLYRKKYPAPSMAEVWRELPRVLLIDGKNCYLSITAGVFKDMDYCGYLSQNDTWIKVRVFAGSAIDALIDLLIWTKKEV
jgi:hypothetical protein